MEACSAGKSNYEPTSLVEAFHKVPHVDINLKEVPDDFDTSLDYFQAVIIWVCVPLLVCVCVFILMSVYYIVVCCCSCCRPKKNRSKSVKCGCAFFVSLVIILCCGLLAASLYAEFKLNENVSSAIKHAQAIQNRIDEVASSAASFNVTSSVDNVTRLWNVVNSSSGSNRNEILQDIGNVSDVLNASYLESTKELVKTVDFTNTANDATRYETIRHWTVVGYLILIIVILVLTSLILLCRSTGCTVVFLVIVGIVTLLVWAVMGGALGGVIIVSDICSDPDSVIRNITSTNNSANNIEEGCADMLSLKIVLVMSIVEVIDYYITCNSSCLPFENFENILNDNIPKAKNLLMGVEEYVEDEISKYITLFESVSSSVQELGDVVGNVSTGLVCSESSGINEEYRNALEDLCNQGSLYGVILMALSMALAPTLILLMFCLAGYAGLLASSLKDDFDDAEFDAARTQSWSGPRRASYSEEPYAGTYRTTSLSNQPPNYSDVNNQHQSVRRHSGEYDHF